MSFRLAALLCLSGLAACNHENTRDAQTASIEDPAPTRTEPMTPASLEQTGNDATGTRAVGDETRANPSTDSGVNPAPAAPLPAPATNPTTASGSTANEPAAADNTKVNQRDRNDAAPTPLDQRENETDLKITQQIRQAVMADDTLSFTAKNVKIITQGGKVTLRGPVNTAQERSAIEAAARKVAGAAQIDNQIEVKK